MINDLMPTTTGARSINDIGTFWSSRNLSAFWDFVFVLLKYIMPGIMIVVAFFVVSMLLKATIRAFRSGADPDDDDARRRTADDDDFEVRKY